jgi:hypothetical protein
VLAAKRELARVEAVTSSLMNNYPNSLIALLADLSSSLVGPDRSWAKKRVCFAALLTGIPCFAVGAVIAVLIMQSETFSVLLASHPLVAALAVGTPGGGLAYLFSCRRLPRVFLEQPIPTQSSAYGRFNLNALQLRISLPNQGDDGKGAIGSLPSYRGMVTPRQSQAIRISLLDLMRATLESAVLVGAIFAICSFLVSSGVPGLLVVLLGCFMLACSLEILSFILLQPSKKKSERWLEYCRRIFPGSRLFFSWVADSMPGLRSGLVCAVGFAILGSIAGARAADAWLIFVAWAFAVQIRARQFLMHAMSSERRDR